MTNTNVAPLEGAQTISMLINGERVHASNGAVFERRNPLDGSVATRAPAATTPRPS